MNPETLCKELELFLMKCDMEMIQRVWKIEKHAHSEKNNASSSQKEEEDESKQSSKNDRVVIESDTGKSVKRKPKV